MKRLFLHLFHMFIVKNEKAHKLAEASLLVLYKVMLFLELFRIGKIMRIQREIEESVRSKYYLYQFVSHGFVRVLLL